MAERFKNTIFMLLLVSAILALHADRIVRAGTMPDFYCDGGEITINITRLSQDNVYIWMDFDGRDGELLTSATAGSGARYTGNGYVFHAKGGNGSLAFPDGQNTDCISVAALDQSRQNNDQDNYQQGNVQQGASGEWPEIFVNGLSLGGKVRAGPGVGYEQTASLEFKSPVVLLQNSGVKMDGFYWFRIQHSGGFVGYQWGGIMCSNELNVTGLYQPCPQ